MLMRPEPMMTPKGKLHTCCKFCQVSASCHVSAITPNSTADEPKTIRPYNAVFMQKQQRRRCCGFVANATPNWLQLSVSYRLLPGAGEIAVRRAIIPV